MIPKLFRSLATASLLTALASTVQAEFKAGTAITDITPQQLPVIVNGGMTSRSVDKIKTPIHARSFAFSDGKDTLVFVIVDSCMVPRDLIDKAKQIASEKSGIPTERILVSATHTHTAPSCVGALGTNEDPAYVLLLTKKLIDAIQAPLKNMQPAQIAWAEIDAADYTASRRWVLRPDRMREDPFGNKTVRANMHAASNCDHATGPSGPEDPILSMISIQTTDGKPLGLLANFSMHYYGDADISPDYFGLFSNGIKEKLAPENAQFVAAMSHGCSGDIWRHDYEKSPTRGENFPALEEYAKQLVDLALTAADGADYHRPESVQMSESRFTLNYRVPDKQRLEWAQRIVEQLGDQLPKTQQEIYAREQVLLHEKQHTEVVVQALRLGDKISIATTPNETYALTGLKIKHASPFPHTMVIELANGGDGYIPPPEQHLLGGYNTWPARTAGLEVNAEPIITETALQLLEQVAGKHRAPAVSPSSSAANAILEKKPRAFYRLDEVSGPIARDASPNHLPAYYEPQTLFYLPGPEAFNGESRINRSVHFAGHRLRSDVPNLGNDYRISLHLWNGMPNEGRETAGWFFSRGRNHHLGDEGDHLGIGGSANSPGKLVFLHGGDESTLITGKTVLERWKWYEVQLERQGNKIRVLLDGQVEIETEAAANFPSDLTTLFFGGRSDNRFNFEGRLDEIAIFDRVATP